MVFRSLYRPGPRPTNQPPPPHALSNHWPARPLFQTHFRCRRRPPPHRVRATNTAPFHEKRPGERPTPRPHVRRTRPYHMAVAHTATHITTTRVTISLLYYQMCILRQLAPSGRMFPTTRTDRSPTSLAPSRAPHPLLPRSFQVAATSHPTAVGRTEPASVPTHRAGGPY